SAVGAGGGSFLPFPFGGGGVVGTLPSGGAGFSGFAVPSGGGPDGAPPGGGPPPGPPGPPPRPCALRTPTDSAKIAITVLPIRNRFTQRRIVLTLTTVFNMNVSSLAKQRR